MMDSRVMKLGGCHCSLRILLFCYSCEHHCNAFLHHSFHIWAFQAMVFVVTKNLTVVAPEMIWNINLYIHRKIRFARVCSHVDDFNTRNKCLTAKLLKQGYRYHKLRLFLSSIADTMN